MLSLIACVLSATPGLLPKAAPHPPARAIWAWNAFPNFEKPDAIVDFLKFADAPKGDPNHKISVVFAGSLGVNDLSDPQKAAGVRLFIRQMHRHHIRVDYLCGKPEYAVPGPYQEEGLQVIKNVLEFNTESKRENSAFDGFQYDVEPYSLPGWPSPEIRNGLVSLLTKADDLIKSAHQKLLLGIAIPRWYDGPDLDGLYKKVIDATDYVAVMDYVHTSTAFVEDGENEVVYGTKSGKKVWLGAETQMLPTEPEATFFAAGNAVMESAFSAAEEKFGRMTGFGGLAIHYYEPYRTLKP